ncbi:MAG TPA: hypothetical protein VH257_23865 [Chloroflexota bacterium]|nr:hypothetical protein [Chloroflexota bacterium]
MLQAFRYLRAALGEFYFDLPRMILLNLFWFITALPFIAVVFVVTIAVRGEAQAEVAVPWQVIVVQAAVFGALALALAGPGTAAAYAVTNRFANGDLMEPLRFWSNFRRYFWRGWLLGIIDAGSGALLVLNIWFYANSGQTLLWLLSIVFVYVLLIWGAVQSYLFAMMVEMDQSPRLAVRNALFMALDNLGLTLGLLLVNVLVVVISVLPGALFLALATMTILSNVHNKAVVEAITRYRASGRIITGDAGADGGSSGARGGARGGAPGGPERHADREEGGSSR